MPEMIGKHMTGLHLEGTEDAELLSMNFHALTVHSAHAIQQLEARLTAHGL